MTRRIKLKRAQVHEFYNVVFMMIGAPPIAGTGEFTAWATKFEELLLAHGGRSRDAVLWYTRFGRWCGRREHMKFMSVDLADAEARTMVWMDEMRGMKR